MSYKLIKRLGSGAFGVVKLYEETSSGKLVAVKIINKNELKPRQKELFMNELESMKILSNNGQKCHKNVSCYFSDTEDIKHYYIFMEYIPGDPLNILIDKGVLTSEMILYIIRSICNGISHIHEKGIVHLDIKPHNIIVNDKEVKIIDYGLGCKNYNIVNDKISICNSKLKGSPNYIKREVWLGEKIEEKYFDKLDVYAFCIL